MKWTKSKKQKEAKKTGNKPVLVNFILDKSGSMYSILNDTIGGFNAYISALKAEEGSNYLFSLTLFHTACENRHVTVDIGDVPELNTSTYIPGGSTALFDAIGSTVAAVESSKPDVEKVLTVILTDGQENSSREYSREAIKTLIELKEKQGNWTFVFLGADLGAFAVGDSLGVSRRNSVVFDTANVGQVFANTAMATSALRRAPAPQSADIYGSVPQASMAAAQMQVRPQSESEQPPS